MSEETSPVYWVDGIAWGRAIVVCLRHHLPDRMCRLLLYELLSWVFRENIVNVTAETPNPHKVVALRASRGSLPLFYFANYKCKWVLDNRPYKLDGADTSWLCCRGKFADIGDDFYLKK